MSLPSSAALLERAPACAEPAPEPNPVLPPPLDIGDEVQVEFSLRGREWKSPSGEVKFFNSLDVWTLKKIGAGAGAGGFDEEPPFPEEPPPGLGENDVPF